MRSIEHTTFGVFAVMVLPAAPLSCWGASPWGKGGVPAALEACEAELEACLEEPCSVFPGDGVTGAPLAYEEPDPPDGTFTDLNTGLMWEIKDRDDRVECWIASEIGRQIAIETNPAATGMSI